MHHLCWLSRTSSISCSILIAVLKGNSVWQVRIVVVIRFCASTGNSGNVATQSIQKEHFLCIAGLRELLLWLAFICLVCWCEVAPLCRHNFHQYFWPPMRVLASCCWKCLTQNLKSSDLSSVCSIEDTCNRSKLLTSRVCHQWLVRDYSLHSGSKQPRAATKVMKSVKI